MIPAVQAAEEKLRKKAEKKGKVPAETDHADGDVATTHETDKSGLGFDGIVSIRANALSKPKATKEPSPEAEEDDEPGYFVNRDLSHLKAALDEADVIIEVLDCRDPLSFRSSHLEELSRDKAGRKTVLILNKIGPSLPSPSMEITNIEAAADSCPRETVELWTKHLRGQYPTFLFRSASSSLPEYNPDPTSKQKGKSREPSDDAFGADAVLSYLNDLARVHNGEQLTVAVVGMTNVSPFFSFQLGPDVKLQVGKSSLINSLTKRATLPIYTLASSSRGPTTTELPQEVTIETGNKKIRLVDTPGILWDAEIDKSSTEAVTNRARDILLRNKGRIDRLKDPSPSGQSTLHRFFDDINLLPHHDC
jgi:nuclear GTP-binding protein